MYSVLLREPKFVCMYIAKTYHLKMLAMSV